MTHAEKKQLTVVMTVLAVLVIVVLFAVPYLRKIKEYDSIIEQRTQQVRMFKRQIANKPMLESEITRVGELMQQSDLFVQAQDPQEATGKLLSTLKKVIEDNGGEIKTVNPLNQRKKQSNTVIVQVTLIANNEQLADILNQLAATKPILDISGARLTSIVRRRGNSAPTDTPLNIVLEVRSFFLLSPPAAT